MRFFKWIKSVVCSKQKCLPKRAAWIQGAQGRVIDLLKPDSYILSIHDTASALSKLCRYTGQCREFYSVAEHVVGVSKLLEYWYPDNYQLQYDGLHHDDVESIVGDMSSPLKQQCPDFKRIEDIHDRAFSFKFKFQYPLNPIVKEADLMMLDIERRQLFDTVLDWNLPCDSREDPKLLEWKIKCLDHHVARALYLERHIWLCDRLGYPYEGVHRPTWMGPG